MKRISELSYFRLFLSSLELKVPRKVLCTTEMEARTGEQRKKNRDRYRLCFWSDNGESTDEGVSNTEGELRKAELPSDSIQ